MHHLTLFAQSLRQGRSLLISLASVLIAAAPSVAAEKIYFTVGPVSLSLRVDSLETFAEDGTINPDLGRYLRRVNPETRDQLRTVLNKSYPLDPVAVSWALYDPMGETLLRYVGQILQTEAGQNGLFGLRAALVKAASRPEGLSLLGMLQEFPTDGIRLDINLLIERVDAVSTFVRETDAVIEAIRQASEKRAALDPTPDLEAVAALRELGPSPYTQQTLNIHVQHDNRTFPVDLYLPELSQSDAESVPVVVISHGLSSSRDNFARVAQHLASHGFAVVLPEHVNSNYDRQQALLDGRVSELFTVSEFVDRPQDVTRTLDELEKLNETTLNRRLNINHVGIIGHSFGGYTALMLAGATVDFGRLERVCNNATINLSLLLQCQALKLRSDPEAVSLLSQGIGDRRIAAVIALNPVSSIFGEQGISQVNVPILIGASGYDPATPIVPEQTQTFAWLQAEEKYLVLAEGASHTPELTALVDSLFFSSVSVADTSEEQRLLQSNVRVLVLAFLQVHIAQKDDYRAYLQPSVVRAISEPPFILSSIPEFTVEQLEEALNRSIQHVFHEEER